MARNAEMPRQVDLMWPILQALEQLGGSASIHELDDRVATDLVSALNRGLRRRLDSGAVAGARTADRGPDRRIEKR